MDNAAEMIFTGDELLRGDAVNTNQAYLGERLLDLGVLATHALCVADQLPAIVAAIRESLARGPAVLLLSGGLGPTEDDLTREATAEALGRPLEHHEDLLEHIRERFESRGYIMGDSNRKQASLPRGASPILRGGGRDPRRRTCHTTPGPMGVGRDSLPPGASPRPGGGGMLPALERGAGHD